MASIRKSSIGAIEKQKVQDQEKTWHSKEEKIYISAIGQMKLQFLLYILKKKK